MLPIFHIYDQFPIQIRFSKVCGFFLGKNPSKFKIEDVTVYILGNLIWRRGKKMELNFCKGNHHHNVKLFIENKQILSSCLETEHNCECVTGLQRFGILRSLPT